MSFEAVIAILSAIIQIVITYAVGKRYGCLLKRPTGKQLLALCLIFVVSGIFDVCLFCFGGMEVTELVNLVLVIVILQTVAVIDWQTKVIPNMLLVMGIGGRIVVWILGGIFAPQSVIILLGRSALGLGICLLVMLLLCFISRHGIGYGDVKLFAYLGFALGILDTYYILFYAALFAAAYAVYAVFIKRADKSDKIAFGPFAYLGFIVVYFSLLIKG